MAITLGKITRFALLVGLLSLAATACTVEEADGGGAGGAGAVSGMVASGGMMASGGMGGMMATGGTSGMGTGGMGTGGMGTGGMMAMPVPCGAASCTQIMTPLSTLMPCCDAATTTCGVITSMMGQCTALMQVGTPDTTCPNGVSILMMPVPGCCRPDNKCGLQSMTLMGCVERTAYPVGFLDPAFLAGAPNLPAQDCGAAPDGGTDAGTDAGDAGN